MLDLGDVTLKIIIVETLSCKSELSELSDRDLKSQEMLENCEKLTLRCLDSEV